MNDIFAEMEKAALEDVVVPTDEALSGLGKLIQEMLDQQEHVKIMEENLKAAKKELIRLEEGEVPEAMLALNLKQWVTNDNQTISCKPFVYTNITKENQGPAYQWLKDNGHEDLIKHLITVNVGKDPKLNEEVLAALELIGVAASDTESVAWQTLRAFVGEQVENGAPIPLELFGAYLGHRATVKKG